MAFWHLAPEAPEEPAHRQGAQPRLDELADTDVFESDEEVEGLLVNPSLVTPSGMA